MPTLTLSDMAFKREGKHWVCRAGWKMNPATNQVTPSKWYRVQMADGRVYEGAFTGYLYKKESLDSPLCRVYLEFDIALGHIELDEMEVRGLIQTAPSAPPKAETPPVVLVEQPQEAPKPPAAKPKPKKPAKKPAPAKKRAAAKAKK